MGSQEPLLTDGGGEGVQRGQGGEGRRQSLCRLFGSLVFTRVGGPTGWPLALQMTLLWQRADASAPPPAWHMPGAWRGRRQESPPLLPTPSQGPQNAFEKRLDPGNREGRLPTISCPPRVTGSIQTPAHRVGARAMSSVFQIPWASLTCSQACPEEGHQPGGQWSRPWGRLCHQAAVGPPASLSVAPVK